MSGAAQAWFIAGTLPLIFFGALHALGTVLDLFRPTLFIPVDRSVTPAMEGSPLRLRRGIPGGDQRRPSMWQAWLGFNISHGLGVFTFGLLCLLIVVEDAGALERIDALRPAMIAIAAAWLAVALRFWFWVPVLITGVPTVCFTIGTVLSA